MEPTTDVLDLFPPGARRDGDGTLVVGGCRLDNLAAAYGTPVLIVDEGHLRETARRYLRAAAGRGRDVQVTFAAKSFPCAAVLRALADEGVWVDVAGHGELAAALRAGVPPECILLHGNAKADAEIGAALDAGIAYVVVDNMDDIDRLERLAATDQRVLVRIIPGVAPQTHDAVSTGGDDSKFGLPADQAAAAMRRIRASTHLRLDGVHIHIGSQIMAVEPFADSVASLASMLADAGEGEHAVFDLGGGLGVRYARDERVPSIETYVGTVLDAADRHLPAGARVLLEPGRSMVGGAGVSLYRVTTVKRTGRTFVAVDGGMGDNLEASLYGQRFEAALAAPGTAAREEELCDVVGHHCESGDRLIAGIRLPRPAVGDLLAVPVTGAYTYALSNNYNGACRPPVVFVGDGRHRAVVRRETLDDLARRDVG